jgi:glycosyltransferase involved in cell wall biosynthesis
VIAPARILICNERFLPRFGHDRSLVLLARELASRGHSISFACLRCELRVLATISRDIHQLTLTDGIELAAADRLAAEIIEAGWARDKPDVLVTGGWPFFELAARSGARGVPSVFIDAGAVPHDGYREPSLSIQREIRRLRRRTLPFIDRILPNSDFTRESQTLLDRGREEGVSTIKLGADHLGMRFDPEDIDAGAEQELLARLDTFCAAGDSLLLALGRFEDEGYKNSPKVFDVFRMVRAEVARVRLLILAGPNRIAVPPDLVADTICLNTLSDATLQAVMHRIKLGLSLSLWEGFNLPLVEMQLISRPVLVFNLAAHPEVVADPWFLCASSNDMATKAVRILTQGVPATIVKRKRFEAASGRARWSNTLARWTTEIEAVAAAPPPGNCRGRRLVLLDVTHSAQDSANSGVINVTRRLASQLVKRRELFVVFAVWSAAGYVLPSEWHRTFLESYSGPKDWLGRLIQQFGAGISLERILDAADPSCTRPPVLLLPEVVLGGDTARRRVAWARERDFRIAFILHDMLPVYEAQYIDPGIVDAFPQYIEALLQADAVWPNSPFSLSEFERYCRERNLQPSGQREAVLLPGQFGDAPRRTDPPPEPEEIRILCVSTVEPRKNHRGLIEAFENLRRRRPELPLRLILVGNGYTGAEVLADWVREAARRDERIEWRGAISQPELEAEFTRASFTVYPSLAEGFGLPVLESLWMGKPCICYEHGVMSELAADGGCMMVDIMDPTELSMAIERLCSDRALIEVLRRQATAREIMTWPSYGEAIARRLEAL